MTPEEDAKYMQRCRVAAKYFFKFCNSLKISKVSSPYYDLFIEDYQNGLSFGVKVVGNGYLESDEFKYVYLPTLKAIDTSSYFPHVPITILNIDEDSETGTCGVILSMDPNGIKINYPTVLKAVDNKVDFERMMNVISLSDYVIRSLRDDNMGILKIIRFKLRYSDRDLSGRVVYRRRFADDYKMSQSRVLNEKDQFYRLIHGIPEEEFPCDFLDTLIVNAINSQFDVINTKSSLFLFNSELRDLKQEYSHMIRKSITIQVEPQLDNSELELLGSILSCPRINLSQFVENPFFKDSFRDELIPVVYDLNEWKGTYENIMRLMPTLTDLSKII